MKTVLIITLMVFVLPVSASAQSFSQLSPAEQSSLVFYNHNGASYAHQRMIKEKLAQVAGKNNEEIQESSNFSQLSTAEKQNTVINSRNNGSAFAQQRQ